MSEEKDIYIRDLFEDDFDNDFIYYIMRTPTTRLWNDFSYNRKNLVENLDNIKTSISYNLKSNYSFGKLLSSDYKKVIFEFDSRELLYKHYLLSKIKPSEAHISFIVKNIFDQKIKVYRQKLKKEKLTSDYDSIRYFAILEILNTCLLYYRLFIKNREKIDEILLKSCLGIVQKKNFNFNQEIKKIFKSLILINTPKALINDESADRYNALLRVFDELDKISFFEYKDSKTRLSHARRAGIKVDNYVTYLSNIPKEHISEKYSKTLTLNYLEKLLGIKRSTLKKRIERGASANEEKLYKINPLSEIDNMISKICELDKNENNEINATIDTLMEFINSVEIQNSVTYSY